MGAECVYFNLKKTSRMVGQMYNRHMRNSGLKGTQYTLLRALSHSGRVAVSKFAERMDIDRTTLTRNLKLLEKEGLIRIESGQDRRVRFIELTDEGDAALKKAQPLWVKAQSEMLERIGPDRWKAMMQELEQISQAAKELT